MVSKYLDILHFRYAADVEAFIDLLEGIAMEAKNLPRRRYEDLNTSDDQLHVYYALLSSTFYT
jgi:hypothetical protein